MANQLTVAYAFATPASLGPNTIVSAQAGQRIIVLQVCVITSNSNSVKFVSSTGPTDVSATFPLAQNGGFVLPFSELGWMQTAIGDALQFTQTSAVPTAIQLVWCPSNS